MIEDPKDVAPASPPPRRISLEDFRPRTLEEIVGQPAVVARLQRLAAGVRHGGIIPASLLFHGPPGIGKTTAARAFGRAVLNEEFANSFTELKAFDDRSPRRMTEMILDSRKTPMRGAPVRILFFDEIETLTQEAQNALRPGMEGEGGTTMFVLACNELTGVSKPMISRCTVLEFTPLEAEAMRELLRRALRVASLQVPPSTIDRIREEARGFPREAIKLLLEEVGSLSSGSRRAPDVPPVPP
ncbi:MAG TPA: AAA family ATPase [Thermoplasmata archaeon]|nr:AAA family ATPase [Thermoplasmata archaeon]